MSSIPSDLMAQLRFIAPGDASKRRMEWRERLSSAMSTAADYASVWDDFDYYARGADGLFFELACNEHNEHWLWPTRLHQGQRVRLGAHPLTSKPWLDACDNALLDWLSDNNLLSPIDGRLEGVSADLLVYLAQTARLDWNGAPLVFDEREDANFAAEITSAVGDWRVWGRLGETDLWHVTIALPNGLFIADGTLRRFAPTQLFPFIALLKDHGPMEVPRDELAQFVAAVEQRFAWRELEFPDNVHVERSVLTGTAVLYLHGKGHLDEQQISPSGRSRPLSGYVTFRYQGKEYPATTSAAAPIDCSQQEGPEYLTLVLAYPDRHWERTWLTTLLGFRGVRSVPPGLALRLDVSSLLENIYVLLRDGCEIWAEKVRIAVLQDLTIEVTSNNDWFDVGLREGHRDRISTWQLINFLKRKSLFIRLDDGRIGILPEAWLERLQQLLGLGHEEGDHWSFAPGHALSLDALKSHLGADHVETEARLDELAEKLRNLSGLTPLAAPEGFCATLRSYQEYGLAWLVLLDELGMGGCLADDMGLGKTVQVLAFFARAKAQGRLPRASLIVVPKSVLGQWRREAERFAPMLNVDVLTRKKLPLLEELTLTHDLLFVSYGLARHQSAVFAANAFHYIVLDEAQTIKNANSKTAIAVKNFQASRRLALSGTPIENSISELLSIFSFLQPGLITGNIEQPEDLVRNLRPLVLRRLKEHVLVDLPEKTETVMRLPLSMLQREMYENVRAYYRQQLLSIEKPAAGYSELEPLRLFFLEGLLRLRQIACHAELVAAPGTAITSNKLIYLLEQLETLLACDHKVVVFSQFVTFLSKIREALDAKNIRYAYLDGQTRERDEAVKSFQEDPTTQIFLVGLKAGGIGLNLTAGDYCFIMDPWWNPAVEQQAIDRLYRMGQRRDVFVYKLVSEATIEEKVIDLQSTKRQTAQLLEVTEQSFLENLSFEDFRWLF